MNCKTSLQSRRTQPARRSPWLLCKKDCYRRPPMLGGDELHPDKTGNRTTKTEPPHRRPGALALSLTRIYWASYTDWQNHQLSIDYKVTDNGPGTAYATEITGATATNGVYLTSPVPVSLGNINQGSYAPFTFKYYIPVGSHQL